MTFPTSKAFLSVKNVNFFSGTKKQETGIHSKVAEDTTNFPVKKKKKIDLVGREKAHLEKLNNIVAIYNLCV